VTAVEDWTWLVVNACHLESLVNLLAHMLIIKVLWPIVTHLNRLVRVRGSQIMLALLVVRLTKLLKFKLTSLLESLVMHLSLGYFL